MKHYNVTFKPDNRQISIHAGATILEAASLADIILNTPCGGDGTCKKCLVNIEPDSQQTLACQHKIQSDLTITIPASSRFFEQKILADGIAPQSTITPDIYKKYLKKDIETGIYGVAVDIGTTTIVAKLIDMKTGNSPATQTALNPQGRYGDDVISRISFAQTDSELTELHTLIIDCINNLIAGLCRQTNINAQQICEICAVGNTTMNHIFLKFPVKQLGQRPFNAFSLEAQNRRGDVLKLNINPGGNIHTPGNIAGFVGSDTTAVALAVDIDSAEEPTLVVDIGTNGEVVLAAGNKLYAASCAAGPALEGARISCGSRATDGAIEAVIINKKNIDVDVIGTGKPRTICGSGLIDAVAVLLNLGVIDSTGRFVEPQKLKEKLPGQILSRIIEKNSQPAFCIHDGSEEKVILTQKDIRQVQLAKAAIRTGIKLLQKKTNLEDSNIQKIYLAGAFGNFIRKQSALRIGLLPVVSPERIQFVGNAAAGGAQMMLLSRQARESAAELAGRIEYIEIANDPDFNDTYADCMFF